MKDAWRSVSSTTGALSVMISSPPKMPLLCADSLGLTLKVGLTLCEVLEVASFVVCVSLVEYILGSMKVVFSFDVCGDG